MIIIVPKKKKFQADVRTQPFQKIFAFMTDPFIIKDDSPKLFKRNTLRHFSFSTEILWKIKKNDVMKFQCWPTHKRT